VTGTVKRPGGEPAAGARIRELASGSFALSAADGTFSLVGLKPGKSWIQAELLELKSALEEIELREDRPPEPLSLLLGEERAPSIVLQVFDAAGTPAAGVFVILEEEGKGQRLMRTAADGKVTATLEAPLPPRLRAAAWAGGKWGLGAWMDRAAAGEGISVVAAGGAGLRVRSASRRGMPRVASETGWDVSWLLRLLGSPAALSPEGPLELYGLPAGRYSVSLEDAETTVLATEGKVGDGRIE
jgi:hypothetical protein